MRPSIMFGDVRAGTARLVSVEVVSASNAWGSTLPATRAGTLHSARCMASPSVGSRIEVRNIAGAVVGPAGLRRVVAKWCSGGDNGGRGFKSELAHGYLAHFELLDLARDRHRERVDELPVAWDLVRGNSAPAEGDQVVLRDARALARLDPRHNFFAVAHAG